MKNLSQLIQEAEERVDTVLCDSNHMGLCLSGEQPDLVKKFLKTELQTIVKESFKNTRVEERQESFDAITPAGVLYKDWMKEVPYAMGYNSALGEIKTKQQAFLEEK